MELRLYLTLTLILVGLLGFYLFLAGIHKAPRGMRRSVRLSTMVVSGILCSMVLMMASNSVSERTRDAANQLREPTYTEQRVKLCQAVSVADCPAVLAESRRSIVSALVNGWRLSSHLFWLAILVAFMPSVAVFLAIAKMTRALNRSSFFDPN